MYKVIQYFTDLQDFNHPYKLGDVFPRLGMKVSEARLRELSSKDNKQGKPLIVRVEEEKAENKANIKPQEVSVSAEAVNDKVQYTKTEINRMPLAELKVLAKDNGFDEELSGAEIKKELIAKFNL